MALFQISSEFKPQGDQEQAIAKLTKSLTAGNQHQTLLGVTGSGKTFTVANVITALDKPTLVMSHNKTLAAQLYSELKSFFPENAVEYFVSYFDYYQPEAYIPRTDTYIEKDSSINDEIERLRLSAMSSLLTRRDVIVIASVSCIYGLGSPEDYQNMMVPVRVGQELDRDELLKNLVSILYERNDIDFSRGKFRVRGDVVEVYPAYLDETAIRVEFFGDEIDRITEFDPLTGTARSQLNKTTFYPAKQFVTPKDKMNKAIKAIREELKERIEHFEKDQQYLEAQRIKQRTEYDIEMMQEMGFCQGIENYSRHLTGRPPGATPGTLLDFFPDDFFTVIDESHVSIPQIGGMYEGDRSRKQTLVNFGFRLPSALDNRPLRFDEYMGATNQRLYVSATPAKFEIQNSIAGNQDYIPHQRKKIGEEELAPERLPRISGSKQPVDSFDANTEGKDLIVELIIRPTGLLDPVLTLRPLKEQIDETIELCRQRIEKGERVLVTTLTKRTAEDLTDYLRNVGLKVRYIHADVDAIERVEILRSLRAAEIDILVGINLLREGLDLPEVSLVCILDADKEGFLRSETSLIQTVGRAARHINGEAVLFADKITDSIQSLINITEYRRRVQQEHNEKHGITPQSVKRGIQETLKLYSEGEDVEKSLVADSGEDIDTLAVISELEEEMQEAASKLEFERAALIRDQINKLKKNSGDRPLPVKKKR
ncbi:MAG: excinuclease ABC subunit UvrB [Verrucomicrobiales bacterium]|nr:excinuclease ABC subunit UvrB [Verrucomicrobiales bacterium]|tara:strand:+ start:6614 stop:8749 length:2136 start_codon:yes stop_codon:yes gene_type:complete